MKKVLIALAISILAVSQVMAVVIGLPETIGQGKWQTGVTLGYAPTQNGNSSMKGYGILGRYGLNSNLDLYAELSNAVYETLGMTSVGLGLNWQFRSVQDTFADVALQLSVVKETGQSYGSISNNTPVSLYLQAGKQNGAWTPFGGIGYTSNSGMTNYGLDLGTGYAFTSDWLGRIEADYNMNYSNGASNDYSITGEFVKAL